MLQSYDVVPNYCMLNKTVANGEGRATPPPPGKNWDVVGSLAIRRKYKQVGETESDF